MRKTLLAIIIFVVSSASFAFAEDDMSPLMVIRFNQDYVSYDSSLEKVVNSAQQAKPSVFFDVVSIVPETKNTKQNKKISEAARYNAEKLSENIQSQGVDPEKIRITYQNSKIAKYNELHVFVR